MPRYDARQLVENIERLISNQPPGSLSSPKLESSSGSASSGADRSAASRPGPDVVRAAEPRGEELWEDMVRWAEPGRADTEPSAEGQKSTREPPTAGDSVLRALHLSIIPMMRGNQRVDQVPGGTRLSLAKRAMMRVLRLVSGRQATFNHGVVSAVEVLGQHVDSLQRRAEAAEETAEETAGKVLSVLVAARSRLEEARERIDRGFAEIAELERGGVAPLRERMEMLEARQRDTQSRVDERFEGLAAAQREHLDRFQKHLDFIGEDGQVTPSDFLHRLERTHQAVEGLESLVSEELRSLREGVNETLRRIGEDYDTVQKRIDTCFDSGRDMVQGVWKGIVERDEQLQRTTAGVQLCHGQIGRLEVQARDAEARVLALQEQIASQFDVLVETRRALAALSTGERAAPPMQASEPAPAPAVPTSQPAPPEEAIQRLEDLQTDLAYLRFQRQFRGSPERLMEHQQYYRELLSRRMVGAGGASSSPIRLLDVACGEGNFLQLWRDQAGWEAHGVDLSAPMVRLGQQAGLSVDRADAFAYLESGPERSWDVITSFQFVEHLDMVELARFLRACRRALKPGGLLLLETLNPHSLISHKWYHLDLTHKRLVFPEVLGLLLESVGMRVMETQGRSEVGEDQKMHLLGDARLQTNFDRLNQLLFGMQDYYILAQRP